MKTFKIEFTEQQLLVINQLLMQAPYNVAAPLIQHINMQIQETHAKGQNKGLDHNVQTEQI